MLIVSNQFSYDVFNFTIAEGMLSLFLSLKIWVLNKSNIICLLTNLHLQAFYVEIDTDVKQDWSERRKKHIFAYVSII